MNIDSLWDYRNPADTEKKFRELLNQSDAENDFKLEVKTQIARTLGLQHKFDEANAVLDEIKSELDTTTEKVKVRYNLERGRVLNSSGNKTDAKKYFIDAYELAQTANLDVLAIDAIHMIAIVVSPEEAIDWNMKAIQLAKSSTNESASKWLGSLYNNTAWSLHDLGRYDEALELFEKNVDWHTENNSDTELRIAKWCVGRTLRSLGKVNEALDMQMNLHDEIKRHGHDEDGYIHEEIAECLLTLNIEAESKKYFSNAFKLLSQDSWLVKNEQERLNRLKELST